MYDEINDNQGTGENPQERAPEPVDSDIKETGQQPEEAAVSPDEAPEASAYEGEQQRQAEETAQPEQDQTVSQTPSFYHYSYGQGSQPQQSAQGEEPEEQDANLTERHKNGILPKLAVAAAVALVFGVVGSAAFQVTNYVGGKLAPQETETRIESAGVVGSQTASTEADQSVPVSAPTYGADISQVAENSMSSIVAITTISVQQVQSMFFGTQEQTEEGSGSGIIVDQNDSELLIATNNHVVEGAQNLSVCFTVEVENQEDLVVEGQIKGTDPEHDLAIVAVKLADIPEEVKTKIKVIEMGDSDQLKVGQQVVAIGNALGYGQSVTVGYVSALNREVTVDDVTNSLIQTDAAINFGNSGGALLNTSGQLIGINSVKAAAEGVEGMGYAIPVNTATPILSDLMNRTTRTKVDTEKKGYMGVTLADVSDEAKEVYNMPSGAFVYSVEEGSAAEKAGFKKGDIITKFDGVTIGSRDEMLSRMDYYEAGETVDVVLSSANSGEYEERTVTITLGSQDDAQSSTQSESESQSESQEQNPGRGGDSVTPFQDLFPEEYFGQ